MGKATYNLKIGTVRMLQNKAVNFLGSYSVSKKKKRTIFNQHVYLGRNG